jgi:hypothetical protein
MRLIKLLRMEYFAALWETEEDELEVRVMTWESLLTFTGVVPPVCDAEAGQEHDRGRALDL